MPSKLFSAFFVLVFVLIICIFAGNIWFGKTLYDECLNDGKTKAQCMKMVNREMQGRGHNISIDEDPE